MAAAGATGSGGNVTFDPTVFAATQPPSARTITLNPANGSGTVALIPLRVPSDTTITGLTSGSGATLTNLVTVNGGGYGPVFNVSGTYAAISGMTITGGQNYYFGLGGGIANSGVLTVSECTISGNGTHQYALGAGIYNGGTLTLISSTVAGNTGDGTTPAGPVGPYATLGGGIYNQGALTLINSTVADNTIIAAGDGAGIYNTTGDGYPPGTLTVIDSTISGNSFQNGATGAGITNSGGTMTVTNSVVAGNGGTDCSGSGCPTNGTAGNVAGIDPQPAGPFAASYGGPTPTLPPLPGSPAICAGVVADIPPDLTTDQRGLPRTTTYGSNLPCVDSGSVQTNYSLRFSAEPPETVAPNTNFTAGVQLSESGNPFPVSGISIPLALGAGSTGSLAGGSAATGSTGAATYSSLQVNADGYPDTLVATLPLTASGITPAATASATSSAFDVIQPGNLAATPTFSLAPTANDTNPTLTITDATAAATIYYTLNGSMPTTSSAVYTKPIVLNYSGTFAVKAMALASGFGPSAVATATYTIHPYLARPTFSPPAGSYTTTQSVTISDISTKTIYYTTNGTMPTTSSTPYSGPITVSSNETINAIAVLAGFTNSPVTSVAYVVEPQLPTPTFGLAPGTYTNTTVAISDSLLSATIHYTTNGTLPTTSSAVYTQPIVLNHSGTITVAAIAVENGYLNSALARTVYTIHPYLARPTFNPPAGSYTTPQTVTISDVSTQTIYYTTNGTMPTTSSTPYSGPITVSANETINAIAVLSGFVNSPEATAPYTIDPP